MRNRLDQQVFALGEAEFGTASASDRARTITDAKNLIRWCLKGDPAQRPTMAQLLAHRFLEPAAAEPEPQPMCYHAFMSHAQVST